MATGEGLLGGDGLSLPIDGRSLFTTVVNVGRNGVVARGYTTSILGALVGNPDAPGLVTNPSPGLAGNTIAQSIVGPVDARGAPNKFTGFLFAAAACVVSGTNPGLTATCSAQGLSNATVTKTFSLASSFVGKVGSPGDTANTSDNNGTATFASTLDVFNFDNPWRGWGQNGGVFPAADQRLHCTSGTCRIWDLRLRASDTTVRNRSGSGTAANAAFVDNATCPIQVRGDRVVTDISGGEIAGDGVGDNDGVCEPGEQCTGRVFLKSAFEILGDDIGDDDGFCESSERCIYAPNTGSYQGEGDYRSHRCVFDDLGDTTPIVNVVMYAYPVNGAP
jgi:hypothetical protein